MGRPARLVLKQTNRPNRSVLAKIKPMPGFSGHANQVSGFYLDCGKRASARVNVKHSPAMKDEAHCVFIVPVFTPESRQHGFQVRCRGTHINYVCSGVASLLLQVFDLLAVDRQNPFG